MVISDGRRKIVNRHKLWGKLYLLVLLWVVFLIIAAQEGRFLGHEMQPATDTAADKGAFSIEEAASLLPGAVRLQYLSVDEATVFDQADKPLGRLLHTQPQARHIIGYGSWLPIIIGLDKSDQVVGLLLQKNSETPGFVKRLDHAGLFASWNGKIASEAVNLQVDAVSRATMTSRATIDSVRLRLAKYQELEALRSQTDYRALAGEILAWAFLLAAISGCFAPAWLGRYRKTFLVLAIAIPGFILGRFFSLELLHNWVINGIPLANQLFMVVVVAFAVLVPFFSGRPWYCTWYCPYGAAQELLGSCCSRKIEISGLKAKLLGYLRPTILAVISLALIVGLKFSLNSVEPFSAFLLNSAATSVIVMALVFLGLSLIIRRPWCNYCCPSGQLVEMLRVGIADQNEMTAGKEAREMKIHAVLNVLLAVAIIILLMSPSRIGNNGDSLSEKVKNEGAEMTKTIDTAALKTAQPVASDSLNPTLTTIYQRKSVRNFTGAEVSRDVLTELVKAGMAAPTARNRQPWQFVVVNDRAALNALAEKLPYAKMLASSAAAIVVCGDLAIARAGDSESMWMLDCSAATQNILLAAESMGLGAVWTAAYPYAERIAAVNSVLLLPEHVVPLCVIPVGRPAGVDQPKDKWKPERLHWNTFASSSSDLGGSR
ncbi:MAG TPA: nitroreductase family protein [Candidatus Rifleibacterium sp.]|nr:nitroreductase family protein [Candidatus Rifleibacterium sp.]HPT45876.1 nitroreductase family protein [Candidatus Rifleibacterium sp.]